MTSSTRPLYGIDAGGSHTSVRTWNGEHWSMPPLNPSSTGQEASDQRLADVFDRIRTHAGSNGRYMGLASARPAIWLATASIAPTTATEEMRRCVAAAVTVGLRAELLVSNDITPYVLDAPSTVGHVVAVCGTGTGFLATNGRSPPVRVGGCEYLGSDEGSAFDLGLRGLRAAVRGLDGRAQRTALSDMLAAESGVAVPELARRLARTPFPKSAVATLAPVVLRAWLNGDSAAGDLVDAAIVDLVLGVRVARDAASVSPGWRLSVAGGVVTGCPEFFSRLAAAAAGLGADPVTLISAPAGAVLAALAPLARTDPVHLTDPRIDSDIWYVDLCDINVPIKEDLPSGSH